MKKSNKKKNNKPFIILIIIVLVVVFVVIKNKKVEKNGKEITNNTSTSINNKGNDEKSDKKQDGKTKTNTSKKFNEAKEINGLKISDISFAGDDKKAELKATVTNISGKSIKDFTYLKITFLTEDDKEIGTIPGIINPVKKKDKTNLNARIRGNAEKYINAYDFKIEVDKK